MNTVKPKDNVIKIFFMLIRGSFYRWLIPGVRGILLIGRGVRIRKSCNIVTSGRLIVEDYSEIHADSIESMSFGKNTSIGAYSVIRPSGYYSRERGVGLRLGDNSSIGIQCYIGCGGGVTIGNNVMMGPQVSIHSESHVFDEGEKKIKEQGVSKSLVVIGDDCWIGAGSRILSGVVVGSGVIIGAGSVVNKNVPSNAIVVGNPAKVLRFRE